MRCSPRRLTYAVKLTLLLFLFSFGEVLDVKKAEEIALRRLEEEYGERVRVEKVSVLLSRPITYQKLDKVELSLREDSPKGSVFIYLTTDKGARRVSILLTLKWRCEVFVATEDLEKGERVYPWQVSKEEVYLEGCQRWSVASPEEFVNFITLRRIAKGSPLERSSLRKEPLVKRGEEVNVVFREGNLEISFTGKALDNGFLGDTVRVLSANTGKVLKGRVISEGSVLVR